MKAEVIPLRDGGTDPLRQALKQALEAEAEARERAEKHKLGTSRAWRAARAAKEAIANAEAEVAKAAEEHVEALADAADAPAPPPRAVRRAREGVEDAAASEHAAQLAWANPPGCDRAAKSRRGACCEYFHIELPIYDAIYAAGLPCESYIAQRTVMGLRNSRQRMASHLRSAVAPWWDIRRPVDVVRSRIEERALSL